MASCHRKCILQEVSDHCHSLHPHRFVANPIIDSARMGLSANTNVPSWSVGLKLNTQGILVWFGSFLLLTIILSIFEEMMCSNCMLVIFFPLHILSLCKLEVGCAIFLPANFVTIFSGRVAAHLTLGGTVHYIDGMGQDRLLGTANARSEKMPDTYAKSLLERT